MNLLRFLEKNENTRKVFGQRELKIIEKQLLGVALTQSEKNRLSRDIRPKFEFIKEAARFESEFKLKKAACIHQLIEEAKEIILNDQVASSIKKIILFGSAATNSLTLRSDIDLAVEFRDITLREATLFRQRTLGRVNSLLDIQVYNVLPEKIKKEIDVKGKTLYESTNQR